MSDVLSLISDLAGIAKLSKLKAPVELPYFGYSQVWHQRTDLDPSMTWLRGLIKDQMK